jgi:hypothetical protein
MSLMLIPGPRASRRVKVEVKKLTLRILCTEIDTKWQVKCTDVHLNIELATSAYIKKCYILDHKVQMSDIRRDKNVVHLKSPHV